MRAARDRDLQQIAGEFRQRRAGVNDPVALKALRGEQRRAEAAVAKAYQPQDFGAWLYRHEEREETAGERLYDLSRHRAARDVQKADVLRSAEIDRQREPARAKSPERVPAPDITRRRGR